MSYRFFFTKKECWYVVVNVFSNIILFRTKRLAEAIKAQERLKKENPHHKIHVFVETQQTFFKNLDEITKRPALITKRNVPE